VTKATGETRAETVLDRVPGRLGRDRWADLAVMATVAMALLLGWVVMRWIEGERQAYSSETGTLTVFHPRRWVVGSDDGFLFRAQDPESAGFGTTYQVRRLPAPVASAVTPTLASVLNDLSLGRAQNTIGYRLLDLRVGAQLRGQPTMESSYVYVDEAPDPLARRMPVVVEGMDVAQSYGGFVYVFSLQAAADGFQKAERPFRAFVETAVFK
jgi:hypothetical protein